MVVFFDIDGTVIDDETQIIPKSTKEAIWLLQKNGHLSVVNTGRPHGHIDPLVRALDFGGWICACGMEVILDGQYLYRDLPTPEDCRWVFREAHRCGMMIQAESDTQLLYDPTVTYTGFAAREAERLPKKGIPVVPYDGSSFVKFVTHDTPGCLRQEFLDLMAPKFQPFFHGGSMIEFIKRGNSKALGMERLLKALDVPREQTFAIGDSGNDLPMFAAAGTTICMGNGMEVLKAQADYVTDHILKDGIWNALKHYGLI